MNSLAAQKSNFSQKCTLLSQYLKENGSFGDLSLEFSATQNGPTTKNLLPMIEKSGVVHQDLNLSPNCDDKEKAQTMTIFYQGKVIVLENIPEEKGKEIMGFANKASNTPFTNQMNTGGDMPRNRSLARFMAKRKDRIRAKAPYQTTNASDDNNKTWLGLAAPTSYQNELQFL